jgi:hypothetical protein
MRWDRTPRCSTLLITLQQRKQQEGGHHTTGPGAVPAGVGVKVGVDQRRLHAQGARPVPLACDLQPM